MTEIGPYERRIGERVPVEPIDVRWIVTTEHAGRFGRRRSEQLEHPGRILDVSVTGAAIEGPPELAAQLGREVHLLTEEGESVVQIKRVAGSAGPDQQVYGVAFVRLHDDLLARLEGLLGRRRPGEEAWRRAW